MERLSALSTSLKTSKRGICLIAASNGNHMNAALFGSDPKNSINFFTRRPEVFKGGKITAEMLGTGKEIVGKVNLASSDPATACAGCSVFILSCPVNAQESLLRKIAPFVPKGSFVGSLFGQGNFDLIAAMVFGTRVQTEQITIFSLFNIPYTVITQVPGSRVLHQNQKKMTKMCCNPYSQIDTVQALAEDLWRVPCIKLGSFLEITLTPGNQIIHPGRVMGIFDNNSMKLLKEQPMFYATMNQCSADNIEKLSNEVQMIKFGIKARFPEISLKAVIPIDDRIRDQYGDDVADPTNLLSIFRTNKGYSRFKCPVVKIGDQFLVNAKARIFTEDVPFGLCVLLDIAEMLELKVPNIVRAIEWHQVYMGKKFVVGGKLNEEEIGNTGAPRRFGFRTIEQYVAHYFN